MSTAEESWRTLSYEVEQCARRKSKVYLGCILTKYLNLLLKTLQKAHLEQNVSLPLTGRKLFRSLTELEKCKWFTILQHYEQKLKKSIGGKTIKICFGSSPFWKFKESNEPPIVESPLPVLCLATPCDVTSRWGGVFVDVENEKKPFP